MPLPLPPPQRPKERVFAGDLASATTVRASDTNTGSTAGRLSRPRILRGKGSNSIKWCDRFSHENIITKSIFFCMPVQSDGKFSVFKPLQKVSNFFA